MYHPWSLSPMTEEVQSSASIQQSKFHYNLLYPLLFWAANTIFPCMCWGNCFQQPSSSLPPSRTVLGTRELLPGEESPRLHQVSVPGVLHPQFGRIQSFHINSLCQHSFRSCFSSIDSRIYYSFSTQTEFKHNRRRKPTVQLYNSFLQAFEMTHCTRQLLKKRYCLTAASLRLLLPYPLTVNISSNFRYKVTKELLSG